MGAPEKARIVVTRQQLLAEKARTSLQHEICKGSERALSAVPVALEPEYSPFPNSWNLLAGTFEPIRLIEKLPLENDLVRLQVWISPKQPFDWRRSELFLKSTLRARRRLGLEIVGNQDRVGISLFCHREDLPIVRAAFRGQFEHCQLTVQPDGLALLSEEDWNNVVFFDFFPPPPYTELFALPDELHVSPYETVLATLAEIPRPNVGFCQILFQPVCREHDWHHNCRILQDLQYEIQARSGFDLQSHYPQQNPSNALTQMSRELETKAHYAKPFFAAAFRIGVTRDQLRDHATLDALSIINSFFLHGGCQLDYLTDADYRAVLSQSQIRDMFALGLTYRSGFLVNSWELTGLVHIPPTSIFQERLIPMKTLETLPIKNPKLLMGCRIGTCEFAGIDMPLCLPDDKEETHMHLIGRPGTGKSTVLEHMILDDISKGYGVAVIDPHGDLAKDILEHIQEEDIQRTIYFNPGDPDYAPCWNPLSCSDGQDIGRTADELVSSIRSVVDGWGDRLATVLRMTFLGLLQLPNASLQDASDLLRRNTKISDHLRRQIVSTAENKNVRQFWREDFDAYPKEALTVPQHKLQALLSSGTCAEMLGQPESRIEFRRIMDQSKILIVDLSHVGTDVGKILGCFMQALLHQAALTRSKIPSNKRKRFHFYVDEAHRFATRSLEEIIAETRKYHVGMILAHQFMSQFPEHSADALRNVGTTIIFNVDTHDANMMRRDLQDMVEVKDLIAMPAFEAIARIGTDIVHFKTLEPRPKQDVSHRDRIIAESRRLYYRPIAELRAARGWQSHHEDYVYTNPDECEEDYAYEVFRES